MSGPGRQLIRSRHDERGSLPLALLAAIIVAGLLAVITATTITGQGSVRFDRDFSEVLHIADGGVQEALYLLRAGQVQHGATGDGTMNGGTYTWTAYRDADREWRIESTGELRGVERTVEINVEAQQSYFPGVFARTFFDNNDPGNYYRSYHSVTGATNTGGGFIGTNGQFDFSDPAGDVDGMLLYGPGGKCTQKCPPASKTESFADPFDIAAVAPLAEMKAECDARGYTNLSVTSNQVLGRHSSGLHCFGTITFAKNVTLTIDGTVQEPVLIYLNTRLSLNENAKICIAGAANCTSANSNNYKNPPTPPVTPAPPAAALQILSQRSGGKSNAVLRDEGKYTVFQGIFHAPYGYCDLQNGEGMRWYGAITCDYVDLDQYNHFWVDQAIADMASAYNLARWLEQ